MQIVYENVIRKTREYQELIKSLSSRRSNICVQGLFETLSSHVVASSLEDLSGQALIVCHTNVEAKKMVEDLQPLLEERLIFLL